MIIKTNQFKKLPGLTAATLSQASDGASTLTLAWRGFGPEWLNYMEPVAVVHRGVVLFAGRVTAYSRTNSGGEVSTEATVTDALWLTDHQTLGAQVAEIEAELSTGSMKEAAQSALQSWAALAESCDIAAPGGWVVDDNGQPDDGGIVHVDPAQANTGVAPLWKREKGITAYTALLTMQEANPDAFFRYRPTTGAVEVVSIAKAKVLTWNTDEMRITEISGVGPQYENKITGVALVITVDEQESDQEWVENFPAKPKNKSYTFLYPENINASDMGVHVVTASVSSHAIVAMQQKYMMAQIRAYFDATNALMYGGSVTALMADVDESPLCRRLNLKGEGTHAEWWEMAAMVTAVDWDFVEGTVTATLGAEMDQPNISELEVETEDGWDDEGTEKKSTTTGTGSSTPGSTPWWQTQEESGGGWTWYSNEGDTTSSSGSGGGGGGGGHTPGGYTSAAQQVFNTLVWLYLNYGYKDLTAFYLGQIAEASELFVEGFKSGADWEQYQALDKAIRDLLGVPDGATGGPSIGPGWSPS